MMRQLVSLFVFLLAVQPVFAQQHSDPGWVTTWSASPSTLRNQDPVLSGSDQTLRLIVHTSAGGEALRLRLANYHGDAPLQIGAVSVARQASGSRIDGPARAVTFAGQPGIHIARGAVVLSDPLEFSVAPATNLVVSFYVPGEASLQTLHSLGVQTNYRSEGGNRVNDASLDGADEFLNFPLLTAVDVVNPEGVTAIVTVGDSITDGYGSTVSGNQRWPNHFARRLYGDPDMPDYAVTSAAISGNRVTTEQSPRFGENLQARFERDALALSNVSHMVLLEGINDIGMSSMTGTLVAAETIISGYRQIISRARARGIKIYGATLLPYEGAGYYSEAGNRVRLQVNDFIRNSGAFDAVIDFEPVVADPANPNRIRSEFTEDNLHPNDAGYKAMADSIDLDLFR